MKQAKTRGHGRSLFDPQIPAIAWPDGPDDFLAALRSRSHPMHGVAVHEFAHFLQCFGTSGGLINLLLIQSRALLARAKLQAPDLVDPVAIELAMRCWRKVRENYCQDHPVRVLGGELHAHVYENFDDWKWEGRHVPFPAGPLGDFPHTLRRANDGVSDFIYATPMSYTAIIEGGALCLQLHREQSGWASMAHAADKRIGEVPTPGRGLRWFTMKARLLHMFFPARATRWTFGQGMSEALRASAPPGDSEFEKQPIIRRSKYTMLPAMVRAEFPDAEPFEVWLICDTILSGRALDVGARLLQNPNLAANSEDVGRAFFPVGIDLARMTFIQDHTSTEWRRLAGIPGREVEYQEALAQALGMLGPTESANNALAAISSKDGSILGPWYHQLAGSLLRLRVQRPEAFLRPLEHIDQFLPYTMPFVFCSSENAPPFINPALAQDNKLRTIQDLFRGHATATLLHPAVVEYRLEGKISCPLKEIQRQLDQAGVPVTACSAASGSCEHLASKRVTRNCSLSEMLKRREAN